MKSVLITGVCGGIGEATARLFLASGWKVFGVDIVNGDIVTDLNEFWQGDVSDFDFWQGVVVPSDCFKEGLDCLVNNAAVQVLGSIQETTIEEWDCVMAVNLKGPFVAIKTLVSSLSMRRGAVVNVASVHANATSVGIAAYATSKGGLVAMTRAAALDLASQNIRVNAILPGAVSTDMLKQGLSREGLSDYGVEEGKNALAKKTPCGRVGKASEIAQSILFLAEEERSSFMTGQSLTVDGRVTVKLCTE